MSFKIYVFTCLFVLIKADDICGDWEPYKNEKCIKVFDKIGLQSFDEAEKICTKNDNAKLITIHYEDEQNFFFNFMFNKKHAVDSVWLGAKYSGNQFKWEDGINSSYTNWAANNPKKDTSSCVQMHSESEVRGKWSNEPCIKQNLVVCEKKQAWTIKKMQEILENVMSNPVPLGFIYVQLPKEASPFQVWPRLVWTDVSANYDSTFFRVTGSKSAEFGQVQDESLPHIDKVTSQWCELTSDYKCIGVSDNIERSVRLSSKAGWSERVWAVHGYLDGNKHYGDYYQFHNTGDEVRPKNMAVKVWKRTG